MLTYNTDNSESFAFLQVHDHYFGGFDIFAVVWGHICVIKIQWLLYMDF